MAQREPSSTGAVQYMMGRSDNPSGTATATFVGGPLAQVPSQPGYALERFVANPAMHPDDRFLRSPPGFAPQTEAQSQARAAAMLAAIGANLPTSSASTNATGRR